MNEGFDTEEAKKFLQGRESQAKEAREQQRKVAFDLTVNSLKTLFADTGVEVYLVGSITQPYMFHAGSDVDIVLKNFQGDRFEIWARLDRMLNRDVEVILFEHCHFQDHVLKHGYKVL